MSFFIINDTPFKSTSAVLYDQQANHIWVTVIKATYDMSENNDISLAKDQEDVCLIPKYSGKPGGSDLLLDSEMVFEHPGTDVLLNGSVYAQNETETVASIKVGKVEKSIKVFGDRYWKSTPFGLTPSDAEPFTTMPISYSRAYGGTYMDTAKEEELSYPYNPIGIGFFETRSIAKGSPLPNIEQFNRPINFWNDRLEPAGFGAISSNWEPRIRLAGTIDDKWKQQRAPLWPEDYSPLFHCCASKGLNITACMKGAEPVKLVNLTPERIFDFKIPREFLAVHSQVKGNKYRTPLQLDRVIIEPDEQKLVLVWRATINCGRDARIVECTTIERKRTVVSV